MAKGKRSRKSAKKQMEEIATKRQEKKFFMISMGITLCLLVLLYIIWMLNN